jgi:hypothetical protein
MSPLGHAGTTPLMGRVAVIALMFFRAEFLLRQYRPPYVHALLLLSHQEKLVYTALVTMRSRLLYRGFLL